MKIPVKYNDNFYYWVDTVVMHDEYDYTCAVLVSKTGNVFSIHTDKITVVDDTYDFEKEKQKCIERLRYEQAQLKLQMELDAMIARVARPVTVVE